MADELLQEFLAESSEHLSQLDQALVLLEKSPSDARLLAGIFRTIHTLKGTCSYLKLNRLERLAHAVENALGKFRDARLPINASSTSLILEGIDSIKDFLQGLEATQEEPQIDVTRLVERLNVLASPEEQQTADVSPSPTTVLNNKLSAVDGPLLRQDVEHSPASRHESPRLSSELSVRVNVQVLESLTSIPGAHVQTRDHMLERVQGEDAAKFAGPLSRLNRLVAQLQEQVAMTRRQRVQLAWSNFSRLVRDLSRITGKPMEFDLHGGDLELDRSILETLRDPLTHLIRNSAAHGIEIPAERRAAGKPEVGRIRLCAATETHQIVICLEDDGAGIDRRKVAKTALEHGLISDSEAETLSEQQLFQLVFQPGFSTAEHVTSVSGRGVGMDVVRTEVERIGGTIEIQSTAGQGTQVRIRIPSASARISSLVMECAGQAFGLPESSVVDVISRMECQRICSASNVHDRVFHQQDRTLPLLDLCEALRISRPPTDQPETTDIVILQAGGEQFCVQVDRVLGHEQVVVRPIDQLSSLSAAALGEARLNDGRTLTMLDVTEIANRLGTAADPLPEPLEIAETVDVPLAPTRLLRFRNHAGDQLAAPVSFVVSVEELPLQLLASDDGCSAISYQGRPLPLAGVPGDSALEIKRNPQPVIICADQQQRLGLVVEQIQEIVNEPLELQTPSSHPGVLGSAVIAGETVQILDLPHLIAAANSETFRRLAAAPPTKVLVIDDSMFFRQLIRKAVESHGYRATSVEGADQAMQLLQSGERFDAILCDIEMPGVDGCQFAAWCRSQPQTAALPLVAITSLDADVHGARILGAGFDRLLIKFHSQQLRDALAELLPESHHWRKQSA
ncbi:MAG: chemotaxis protein CheW [Planctomycetaceae bacterium]